jgi:hypothetical protein
VTVIRFHTNGGRPSFVEDSPNLGRNFLAKIVLRSAGNREEQEKKKA